MKVTEWKLPIAADWSRSLEMNRLSFESGKLELLITTEEQQETWRLTFFDLQAFRCTTEECASTPPGGFPSKGACFEVVDSPWIIELGRGSIPFLEKSRHFLIRLYDEVVEVVAWRFEVERA